jgi:hypothetical protein
VRFEAPEVHVVVTLDGAVEASPRALDLGGMTGTRVVLHRAFASGDAHTTIACVVAPTTFWVPGLEAMLLDAASAKARVGAGLATLSTRPVVGERPTVQEFVGSGPGVHASGRHVLGFVGDARDVLVCSALCLEPATAGTARPVCDEAVLGWSVETSFVEAPPPGLLMRLALSAADSPRAALASGLVAAALVVIALLRTRPRPGRSR